MPKRTEMFTVITSLSKSGNVFSLYWVPSRMPSAPCQGLSHEIDSYTVFWCKRKKTFGNRCKEKLDWLDIKREDLSIKDISSLTSANIIIYEKNITHLTEEPLYSFGIAANSGNYSSGIRWSSCIVDESESPLPPLTEVESLTNSRKMDMKCNTISAVPIGFNVSYCRSFVEDFGHCDSDVHYVEINSPTTYEVLISNLNPGGRYIFSVSVLSIIGEGLQSYPKIIRLREDIPAGPPRNLEVLLMSNVSVTLSWDPPSKAQRRGRITKYKISVVPPLSENIVVPAFSEEGSVLYELKNLKAFTKYTIFISSCNSKGCSVSNPAKLSFSTLPGVPDEVENFILDVSNWRLMWDLNHCNSRVCSFDVQLPINETDYRIVTINDKEILSLHEEGIPCNYSEMKFAVRARGQDSYGHFLFGNWTTVLKEESECPSGSVFVLSQKLNVLLVPIIIQMQKGLSPVGSQICSH
ncbi:Protein sidekick-like protein [Armadillidium vulgare]|nr:Protein sidekick-like protein [Armadillidium vulgare]